MKIKLVYCLLLTLILVSCSGAAGEDRDQVLFRDDFDRVLAEGWRWGNEDPDRWEITEGGWLSITASNQTLKVPSEIIGQTNVLLREAPQGDIVFSARLQANPTEEFQQAAIYLIGDGDNYVAINTEFCPGCCPDTVGACINMEAVRDNLPLLSQPYIERDPEVTDLYLRLVYLSGPNTISGYFAITQDDWQQAFVVNDPAPFNLIAIGTTNAPGPNGIVRDLVASYDWVEVLRK